MDVSLTSASSLSIYLDIFRCNSEKGLLVREHMFKNELPWEICEESKPLS